MSYFSEKVLADLTAAHGDIHRAFNGLRYQYVGRAWKCVDARQFAMHGFARRLGTLVRNVDCIFEILPPEINEIPVPNRVADATTNLHSFVINVCGCLDNLAWIWVYERGVTSPDGQAINPLRVGFEKKNREVRASLRTSFVAYLDKHESWFTYMKGFRDSLAHRIPLYIPPFVVHPDQIGEYERLEREMAAAMNALDLDEYEQLSAKQKALGKFRPWISRSLSEAPKPVLFHAQVIADFRTVEEIAKKLLEELEVISEQSGLDKR